MNLKFIKVNKAKCHHCNDIVVSDLDLPAQDFKCSCGRLVISGGSSSLVRKGQQGVDFTEMSVMDFSGCDTVREDIQDPPPEQGQEIKE